jgi:mannose-6-phosphate isomerase-like protein (cupin superfamily)
MDEIVLGPGDGEPITRLEHREVVLLSDCAEMSITRSRYGPGERGPDPHVHRRHVDSFYVLEGELAFLVGPDAARVDVGAGGFVAVPPNLVHSFANEGSATARFLNFHTPDGGFAAFMRGRRDGRDVHFDSFDPPADGGRAASDAELTGEGEGERLVTGSRVVLLRAALPELCFAEWELDGPFEGPEEHHHDAQVDCFCVLEGVLDLRVGGASYAAGPGTLAAVPPGVRHTFAHTSVAKGRVLNVHAPDGGFADFLRRIAG